MLRHITRRLAISIPTFLGITILVYVLASLAPGSPLEMLFVDSNASADAMEQMKERLGLDQPVYIQYLRWLGELLHGNMGISYRTGHAVWADIAERIGPTLLITLTSVIISVSIAIPLGILSAYKPYSIWDYLSSGLSFMGAATPNFFAGLVLIYIFSVNLKLLPSSGMYDSAGARSTEMVIRHMILPVLVLMFQQIGGLIRQTRASMLEVLQEDYARTARSKGCKEPRVLIFHALRNALTPVVTRIGSMIPFIIGGAVTTETLFAWPGLGSLMVLSINSRDYPVIMGITVLIAAAVLMGNILIDILYGLLDPRIRYE